MIEIKDGQVFKDGALVGVVEGEALVVPKKLHHKTVAILEKETRLKVVVEAAPDRKPPEPPTSIGNPIDPVTQAPPTPPADMGIPISEPEPPQDHRGDKTPAYVDWLFRNRPEEAATRYANRVVAR